MKTHYTVTLAMVAGFGLGAVAVQGLHAQAKAPVWDSMEKIQAWRANPEYIELRKIGDKYAKFRSFAVEGVPQ